MDKESYTVEMVPFSTISIRQWTVHCCNAQQVHTTWRQIKMLLANPKHNNKTKPYTRTRHEDVLPEQVPQIKFKSAPLITLEGNHIKQTQCFWQKQMKNYNTAYITQHMYFLHEIFEINVNWRWPTQVETRNFYVTISDKINTVVPAGKNTIILRLEFNRGHETQSNSTNCWILSLVYGSRSIKTYYWDLSCIGIRNTDILSMS